MKIPVHRFTFILLIFLSIPLTSIAQTVNIPDPNLRTAIEERLGKASGDPITTSDMAALTYLGAGHSNISDLTGLEHAINLAWLSLKRNLISDISSLGRLTNLTELRLGENSISDITSLGGLTNLTELDLGDNLISDITSLGGLTNLTWLSLERNLISDISSLSGLTNLTELYLGENSISDISSLGGLTNLTWLYLDRNLISDISSLDGLTNLTRLNLDENSISDLSALVANKGLGGGDTVYVKRNPLSSVSIDTHIPTLQSRGVTVEFDDIVAGVVEFPDSSLRAAIEGVLDIASGDPITTSDMAALTWLFAVNSNISDLTGLEYAINLTELYLGENLISDISVLGSLTNLTGLFLDGNLISDILVLGGLTNLTELNLGRNSISDISSLGGLTNLTDLSLSGNSISDISVLEGLTNLTELYLGRNSISDLSALVANKGLGGGDTVYVKRNLLSSVSIDTHIPTLQSRGVTVEFDDIVAGVVEFPDSNLRAAIETALDIASGDPITTSDMAALPELHASGSNIIDLTGLEHAINLTWLNLGNNSVSDVTSLSELTNLTWLSLDENSISDITSLGGLTNLTRLYLSGNLISDISVLGSLTNLTWLSLERNLISDVTSLGGLTNLTRLSLGENLISDITSLGGLTNLTRLSLDGNLISDITSLGGLTNLTRLYLDGNLISDITSLGGLTNLTRLYLSGNLISDISVLGGLTNLTRLYLDGNLISDISVLGGLTNLTRLSLGENSISDISVLGGLTNLTRLSLDGNSISDISALVTNTGLGSGDTVNVRRNPLSYASINTHVPTLQSRGVAVTFNDQAHRALLKVSGDNQEGVPNETLAKLLVIGAQDTDGSALVGISVTFTVLVGGGTLSTTKTMTDANGRAQSLLTLGPNLGTNTVSVSATEVEGVVTFNAISDTLPTEYRLSIPAGISLIHVPLKVTEVDGAEQTIESVGDLYDVLGSASTVNFLITYDSSTQEWLSYFGPSDKGTPADRGLTDDMGIIAGLRAPVSVQLSGDALGTDRSSTITLNQGLNLVGLPLRDPRIARVSDLFALEGIGGNVPVIILTDSGEFKLVGRAGDPGDIEITGGQAFILTAQRAAIVDISGDAWANDSGAAAPPVTLKGIEVGDTTPVLGLRGSIVDEEMGVNKAGLRVRVKNLSTGRAITTVTRDEKIGYQLTVVAVETGRAATIGDILEISAQSPDPFIGVQQLQYIVTAEDVKQGWIQLPALVAYEIPTETQLLANYPNPFNPETWIPYRLAEDAFVTLAIYDSSGHVVRTLDVGHRIASAYESRSKTIYWDGRNRLGEQVASGVYFYHLSAGDYSATRKMLVMK